MIGPTPPPALAQIPNHHAGGEGVDAEQVGPLVPIGPQIPQLATGPRAPSPGATRVDVEGSGEQEDDKDGGEEDDKEEGEEEEDDYVPALPPHLLAARKGGSSSTSSSSKKGVIGPSLPPSLQSETAREKFASVVGPGRDEHEGDDDDDNFGPRPDRFAALRREEGGLSEGALELLEREERRRKKAEDVRIGSVRLSSPANLTSHVISRKRTRSQSAKSG